MNNYSSKFNVKSLTIAVIAAIGLQACAGGTGAGGSDSPKGTDDTYLNVSVSEFYFGTRNIGSSDTQTIKLTNQSGDLYPINAINISGASAAEFISSYSGGGTTLKPGESIKIDLTFAPISTGRKHSSLDIDHGVIKQVTHAQNVHEQNYYRAKKLEQRQEYSSSLTGYQEYLSGKPVTDNKRRASIKVPVLSESERHADKEVLRLYTQALDLRESSDLQLAVVSLEKLVSSEPNSYLADDALYMQGYIQLMDTLDYNAALNTMNTLRSSYPDSSYYDTALYVEAIALKEMGETEAAREKFQLLRKRHTGLSFEMFELKWPKDNYVSRLWFDRSTQGLDSLT